MGKNGCLPRLKKPGSLLKFKTKHTHTHTGDGFQLLLTFLVTLGTDHNNLPEIIIRT